MVKNNTVVENYEGSVNFAYSKLRGTESQSSCSSRSGSLSVERDADSEDESLAAPKKKQDRRLSRAKRTNNKEQVSQCSPDLSVRLKSTRIPFKRESSSASESRKQFASIKDGDVTEEEDWTNSSPLKDSESASVTTSASEGSDPNNSGSGCIRLTLSQPKKRDDKPASPPGPVRASDLPLRKGPSQTSLNSAQQRTTSPRRRLVTRNERDMLRAVTTKRPREAATHSIPNIKKGKENTPAIETHIKVLYI